MPFTWLDIILLVIMLISALLAMMRGFTREVLSIVAWVCAAIGAYFLYEPLLPMAKEYIQPDLLAKGVLIGGAFILILIIISLFVILLTEILLESRIGALDRTLGFIFGLGRGLLLVTVAFLFFNALVPQQNFPEWIKNARTMPILQSTGKLIVDILPKGAIEELVGQKPGGTEAKTMPEPKAMSQPTPAETSTAGPKATTSKKSDSGYQNGERQGLNQLLESATGTTQ